VEDSSVEDVNVTEDEVLVVSAMDEDGAPVWKEYGAVTAKQPRLLQRVVVYGGESKVMVVVRG